MSLALSLVDAFAAERFGGNPAAVCLLPEPRDDRWMAQMAAELAQAATAFVTPRGDGDGFSLRWFSPANELALCGHGTLAASHVLWERGYLASEARAIFHTLSGRLSATRRDGWIDLDFPATHDEPVAAPPELTAALGVTPLYVGQSRLDYLIEVESAAAVRALAPAMELLRAIPVRGFIVTARSDTPDYDIVSRFFSPTSGEDAVTGSAHCTLGPYWSTRLGKSDLVCYQASARGGVVHVRVESDGARVTLSGRAVTVLRGDLL